jgi:hypothetical protein
MESSTGRLNQNEIRCPYCRKKQKKVLPYYEELGLNKINGVNNIDVNYNNYKSLDTHYYCEYLTPNPTYDPSGNYTSETNSTNVGNCKFLKCLYIGSKINYSDKKGLINHNFGDEKNYCYFHKSQLIKIYKKEKYNKDKEEAKKSKEELKEQEKKKKEEIKKTEKEEKKQLKKISKQLKNLEKETNLLINTDNENKVIGTIHLIENQENQLCNVILKTGQNKGKICGCKITNENLCTRHYNLKNNTKNKDDK